MDLPFKNFWLYLIIIVPLISELSTKIIREENL